MDKGRFEVEEIREGLATILTPRLETYRQGPEEYVPSRAPVFYNPLMKENRDLAIAFLRALRPGSRGSLFLGEPLTGTGVRGIRAVLEADIEHAWINDISNEAAEMAEKNVRMNGIADKVTVENKDANVFDLVHSNQFNYLDLDPFGSPAPFLNSAVQAVRDGGLIAVTATDTATLCGVYPEKAMARYGGRSIKTIFPKEFAARLLIYAIVGAAAKIELGARPLLAYASRHYIRAYCQLRRGNRRARDAIDETGHVLYCKGCFHREGLKRGGLGELPNIACPICGKRRELAGPIWLGPHSDQAWVQLISSRAADVPLEMKIRRMLGRLSLEDTGIIGSYPVAKISQYCRRSPPGRERLLEGLRAIGINACEATFEENAIKTAADINQILGAF